MTIDYSNPVWQLQQIKSVFSKEKWESYEKVPGTPISDQRGKYMSELIVGADRQILLLIKQAYQLLFQNYNDYLWDPLDRTTKEMHIIFDTAIKLAKLQAFQ